MKKIQAVLPILLLFLLGGAQQVTKPKLIAGPIVGSVTKNSVKVWIAYQGTGHNLIILGDTAAKRVYYPTGYSYITDSKGRVAISMDFTDLSPDHQYNVLVSIDGWGAHGKCSFRTQADTTVKDFSFVVGSCALMIPGAARTVFPGGATWIFHYMRKKNNDFMVWLGDNLYYLGKDYQSIDGMFDLNIRLRKSFAKYRDFLSSTPQYAIWDDHDYGPNDSGKEFALKDSSLKIFKSMWPNTYPEGDEFNGNFFTFRYYDAEFFMTDNRYYRDTPEDTAGAFFGEAQMIWLKNKLLLSDAAFKLIAVGSQVINDNKFGESYADYSRERSELLDFIANNNIKGVMFLTGDKHYTELSKIDWKGYPVYDLTCSPLTSPPLPRLLLGAYKNSNRVKGFDYGLRNFGRISFSGNYGHREMKIEIYGRNGLKKKQIVLNETDLQKP